eukprot:CAMPEP_0197523034 /NCGR_PEP_ID=MMETSP1318-20131121/8053_1 /TAXON_ID=552666 /ORGANISM="Partenskyella glossopodia, Strain RCC365" /LENGTH=141 /DNA_ID=CAMNT_0043075599 /DNA_START=53 /DNA_END=478 /DNA_ORIENTATION=+
MGLRILLSLLLLATSVRSGIVSVETDGLKQGSCSLQKNSNDECMVSLKGNPTTGFRWLPKVENPSLVKTVELEYQGDPNPSGMMGVGGTFRFRVIPTVTTPDASMAIVNTQVKFYYARPFTVHGEVTDAVEPGFVLDISIR